MTILVQNQGYIWRNLTMFYKMLNNIHIFNSSTFSKGLKMGLFLAHFFSEKSLFFFQNDWAYTISKKCYVWN